MHHRSRGLHLLHPLFVQHAGKGLCGLLLPAHQGTDAGEFAMLRSEHYWQSHLRFAAELGYGSKVYGMYE